MVSVVSGKIEGSLAWHICLYSNRKSQLAIEYAQSWKSRFPDGWVFWIHASSAARFEHSVRDVLSLLQLYGRQIPNADMYELLRS
jgi:hypothetical protein